MKGRRGFTLIELLVVITIIAILAAILFPVFAKARDAARTSTCQSNMNQIGKALKSYASDWDDMFPTNRDTDNNLSIEVPLADVRDESNFRRNGVNWVESLYAYVEKVGTPGDNSSVWKCPKAKAVNTTANDTAANSYVLNFNLIEQPEAILKLASNTMMIREMDRLCGAICRPTSLCDTSSLAPSYPFLTNNDPVYGSCKPKIHGNGSNILFADGHVATIQLAAMPQTFAAANWDSETLHWWNYAATSDKKAIVVNP